MNLTNDACNKAATAKNQAPSSKAQDAPSAITISLGYRAPYAWERIIGFLGMRAIPGVEAVKDGVYYRTASIPHLVSKTQNASEAECSKASNGQNSSECDIQEYARGWISVSADKSHNKINLTISPSLLDVLPQVITRTRHLFDLDCDPVAIEEGLRNFDERCPGKFIPGTRLPGCFDPFEMSVRAILGQQISVKGASTLAGRVAHTLGEPLNDAPECIDCTFPSAESIAKLGEEAENTLGELGIVRTRTKSIRAIAEGLIDGSLDLTYGADPEELIPALEAIPGIGPWTANYVSMRATGYPDAFPATDLGVKKALDPLGPKEIVKVAEAWRPWRAYATMSLWSE